MGGNQAKAILKETFDLKETYLFLTKEEIYSLYRTFVKYSQATSPEHLDTIEVKESDLPVESVPDDEQIWLGRGLTNLLRIEQFLCFPCMKASPFAPRLYECFKDQLKGMTLESFMMMASAFHPRAPVDVKYLTAYKIFDYDNDGVLKESDVRTMLEVITGKTDLWDIARQEAAQGSGGTASNVVKWEAPFPSRAKPDSQPLLEKTSRIVGSGFKQDDPESHGRRISTLENRIADLERAIDTIAKKTFESVDIDKTGELNESELEKVLSKMPDFQLKFSARFD